MSERVFEAFRDEAERLTEVPAFELIEQQGRALRRRRHAVVGAVAAGVLAVTGVLATAGGEPRTLQPSGPAGPSVTPYPPDRMITLDEGTYELHPYGALAPAVRLTLPQGWNAWEGPNRFEGIQLGSTDNDPALGSTTWLAGVLVLGVERVAAPPCRSRYVGQDDPDSLAQAITRIPGMDVVSGPERTVRFGRPVTHVRLRHVEGDACGDFLFSTAMNGRIGFANVGRSDTYDAWVIQTDDRPILVWAPRSGAVPEAEVNDLMSVVDSIVVVDRP
jgi:hypothetical protein